MEKLWFFFWFSPSQLNFFIAEIRTARITHQFGATENGNVKFHRAKKAGH